MFQGSEIYGGLGSTWDYGPLGVELKRNVKEAWWQSVIRERDDMVGLDAAILMHPQVWTASGHVENFSDPWLSAVRAIGVSVATTWTQTSAPNAAESSPTQGSLT